MKAWSQRTSGRISRPVTGAGKRRLPGHAERQGAVGAAGGAGGAGCAEATTGASAA